MKRLRRHLHNFQKSVTLYWQSLPSQKGILPTVIKIALSFFSLLWRVSLFFRHLLYDLGLFSSKKFRIPIVSVGGISLGGSGKTPAVLFLSEELYQQKIAPCILTRGYKSEFESKEKSVLCTENGPKFSWKQMGDEPFMMAKQMPQMPIWVGKNRIYSAKLAEKQGVDLCILDDGLQYRKLQRDFELITLQSAMLFEPMLYFPRGKLRDTVARLKKADLVMIQNVKSQEMSEKCLQQIRKYTFSPAVTCNHEPAGIFNEKGEEVSIDNCKVGLFCSIAEPSIFCQMVEVLGGHIVEKIFGSDHMEFSDSQFEKFADSSLSKGSKFLICTEKDWVKLSENKKKSFPIIFLKMKLKIISGEDHWKIFVEKISNKVNTEAV